MELAAKEQKLHKVAVHELIVYYVHANLDEPHPFCSYATAHAQLKTDFCAKVRFLLALHRELYRHKLALEVQIK